MMANVNPLGDALVAAGMDDDVATQITTIHGIRTLTDSAALSPEDQKELFKLIVHPGGTVQINNRNVADSGIQVLFQIITTNAKR